MRTSTTAKRVGVGIAGALLAAGLGSGGTWYLLADDTPSAPVAARDTLTAVPAACDNYLGDQPAVWGRVAAHMRLGNDPRDQEARNVIESGDTCDSFTRGQQLSALQNMPLVWDEQCVQKAGATLSNDRDPARGRLSDVRPATTATVDAVSSCARLTPTTVQCEEIRAALDPVTLSLPQKRVLESLNCTNTENRPVQ